MDFLNFRILKQALIFSIIGGIAFTLLLNGIVRAAGNIDSLNKALNTASGKDKFLIFKELGKYYQQSDPVKSAEYAEKERLQAITLKNRSLEAEALNDLAIPLAMSHQNKQAFQYLQRSLFLYDSLDDQEGWHRTQNNIAIVWSQMGSYENAIRNFMKIIPYYEQHHKHDNLARIYMSLGLSYENIRKHDLALSTTLKAKDIIIKLQNNKLLADISVNLGIIYQSLKKYPEAEEEFLAALKYYQSNNQSYGIAITTNNLGKLFKEKKDYLQSVQWYNTSLEMITKIRNPWAAASVYYDLAEISTGKANWQEALNYLHQAESFNNMAGDLNIQSMIYRSFYKINDTLRKESNALFYLKKYLTLNDSLQSYEKERILEGLTIQYDLNQKETENQLLKNQVKVAKLHQKITTFFSLAGLLVSIFLIVLLYLRRRNLLLQKAKFESEKQLKELELEKSQAEKLFHEEEVQKKQVEIQLKEQELLFQTLQRTELTNINRSVQEKLLPFHYKISNKKDQNEFLQVLNDITREANKDPLADFEILFTQANQKFNENLLKRCPAFTKSELQICALIKMNLSTKDISRLLNISPASVDITRHRIRQKLELESKDNLSTFLMSI